MCKKEVFEKTETPIKAVEVQVGLKICCVLTIRIARLCAGWIDVLTSSLPA